MKKEARKLAACTLAAVLAASSLTGCGGSSSKGNEDGTSAAEQPAESAAGGGELNILCVSTTFADVLESDLIPEFEDETGIKVNCEVLAEEQAMEKLLADLSSGTGTYDLFMTSPMYSWQYVQGGWIEPLDDYINDPEKTSEDYDLDDFVPGILNSCRWTGEKLTGVGEGNLWSIPVNYESYMLSYRPSVMKKYGLEVPKTYDELSEMVTQLSAEGITDDNGQSMYAVVTRFDKYWDLSFLTFGTMLQSYGVTMLDEDGNVAIASDASVEATEKFVKMIQEGSPEGAGQFTFYEAEQGFASGQYLFSFNEADGFVSIYEDPEQSVVSDDVGFAVTPEGPEGRSASTWVWSLGMNSASKNKEDAWKCLQWLTSSETMIKSHLLGNMNPVRNSAWEDEGVLSLVNSYGEQEGQYAEVCKAMADCAELTLPAHPEIIRALDKWAEAVQKVYYNEATAKDALTAAAEEITEILK